MKIKLERTPEQIALIKEMASADRARAQEARQSFAAVVGPLLQKVLEQAPVVSNLFDTLTFDANSDNSIPLDFLWDVKDEDYIHVWSQNKPGGLATQLVGGEDEIKFSTYSLFSAIAFNNKYIESARLDVVSKGLSRMAQEILLKQEVTSINVIAAALMNAITNNSRHVLDATVAGILKLHDFNRLMTLKSRIWTSYLGGTTNGAGGRGITDMLVSPEVMQSIREWTYNPVNTRDSDGSTASGVDSGIPATDEMRNQLYRAGGIGSVYGINLIQINELGAGQKYTKIFDAYAASTSYDGTTFSDSDDIAVGIDAGVDNLIRPVKTKGNQTFVVEEDDQFLKRQEKIGFYGSLTEGRLALDSRGLCGIIV